MAQVNIFEEGRVANLSEEINLVPNRWGVLQNIGLFQSEYLTQKVAYVPRTVEGDNIIIDRNWEERRNAVQEGKRDTLPIQVPHFPLDDAITPSDVDGRADWTTVTDAGVRTESVDSVRARKMARLRRAHALTLDVARFQLLRDGTVYAPSGTVDIDFYDAYGVQREEVFFDLGNANANPNQHPSKVLGLMQDALGSSQTVSRVVAVASPGFFNKLIGNPFVYEAYQYFQQPQGSELLSGRLVDDQNGPLYRRFTYGGIDFIEVRGEVGGEPLVEDDKAYAFPLGTNTFRTYYSPAHRLTHVNTVAMESYYFEYPNEKDDIIEIMSETNFLNAALVPDAIVTLNAADE